jgi:hypothetical protein
MLNKRVASMAIPTALALILLVFMMMLVKSLFFFDVVKNGTPFAPRLSRLRPKPSTIGKSV